MPPVELLDPAVRFTMKRQSSMENLKDSETDKEIDGDEILEFSDHDELLIEKTQARENESSGKLKAQLPKPERARLVKPLRYEEDKSIEKDHRELQRAHSEVLGELRLSNRENREQSLELKDLKKQNTQIREAYNRLYNEMSEDPQRFSKRERSKYHDQFQMMERHITFLQVELEKRDNHIEMLTKQTREANQERDELDSGNRKLQGQIKELSANLTECKDDLLRLQPVSQTSDSEISDQYSNLCQQIAGWVDDQTEDVEILEERFEVLDTVEELDLDPSLASQTTQDHLRLIQEHPDSIPLLLQRLIHSYVNQYILGDSVYFFGLDAHSVLLIQQFEQGMRLLEPARDVVTLRRWRSEALLGLLKVDGFVNLCTEQGQTLARSLYSALAHMLGGPGVTVSEEGWKDLYKQVFLPAIDLATAIRISMADYHFVTRLFRKSPDNQNVIYHNEIQHYHLVDNATHKIVRPDSALKIANDGRIGEELIVVSPALMRLKDTEHKVIVSKPTILIKLDQPMEKRSRGMKGLGSFVSSFLSGDSAVI